MPAANIGSPGVLTFRVNPNPDKEVTLRMRLNQWAFNQSFNTEPQRSWHVVVPPNTLRATGNELIVSVTSGSSGTVQVSDIVLLFQANIS